MAATDLLSSPFMGGFPSITGGAAAPSSATATGNGQLYIAMNNPFNVAGQGGTASGDASASNGAAGGFSTTTMLMLAIIVGAVLIGVAK